MRRATDLLVAQTRRRFADGATAALGSLHRKVCKSSNAGRRSERFVVPYPNFGWRVTFTPNPFRGPVPIASEEAEARG
jgi:hypothetical protein